MGDKIQRITVTPAEVEAIFGIPRGTLANLRWARKGPRYFKVGGRRILYKLEDVKAWIENCPVLTIDSIPQG